MKIKLIGQNFDDKEKFKEVVKDVIGEENFEKVGFKENLVTHAKMDRNRVSEKSWSSKIRTLWNKLKDIRKKLKDIRNRRKRRATGLR